MAQFTIELRTIHRTPNNKVFSFDYDFYDQLQKTQFEEKFIDHYFFNEIGQETVGKFKHRLRAHLNKVMPYYSQLYQTELASKKLDFLLNKDLKETFIRENTTNGNLLSTDENKSKTQLENESLNKDSQLNNGISQVGLSNNYLTGTASDTTTGTTSADTTGTTKTNTENNERESTTLISQGNIGVTSSAELLEKWRNILINIDEQIIESCEELFMQLY